MTQTLPLDFTRDIERRWQRRPNAALPQLPRDHPGGCCPTCKTPTSIAPLASEYRSEGIVHQHRLCRPCGHEWIAVERAPA